LFGNKFDIGVDVTTYTGAKFEAFPEVGNSMQPHCCQPTPAFASMRRFANITCAYRDHMKW
jgi:hypothetical protein